MKVKFLFVAALLMIFSLGFYSCVGPVPVDVVMIDGELFFVLEEPHEISFLRVSAVIDKNKTGMDKWERGNMKEMWALRHNLTSKVEKRKYPRLKQIKYGQKFEEFPEVTGPFELQRNVEYLVGIDMGDKFARETFIITDDNKAIMPKPRFERQKSRIYSVSVDKDGNKTLILEPVSK